MIYVIELSENKNLCARPFIDNLIKSIFIDASAHRHVNNSRCRMNQSDETNKLYTFWYALYTVIFYENAKYLSIFLIVIDLRSLFKFIRFEIGCIGHYYNLCITIMKWPPESFSLEKSSN